MNSPITDNVKVGQNNILRVSLIFNIIIAVIALILGIGSRSQVIIFDAIYSIVGLILLCISMIIVMYIDKKDVKNYPFGKETFEPLFVFVQYQLMLVLLIGNIIVGINSIRIGGNEVDFTLLTGYAFFAMVFCFIVVKILKRIGKDQITPIQDAQIVQWNFSFYASVAILVGFIVAIIMYFTPLSPYVVFVDPVMTILYSLYFLKVTFQEIVYAIRQILLGTPSKAMMKEIKEKARKISDEYKARKSVFKVSEVGNLLTIEITYVIDEYSKLDCIVTQDELRDKIYYEMQKLPYKIWLNISFTADPEWTSNY